MTLKFDLFGLEAAAAENANTAMEMKPSASAMR